MLLLVQVILSESFSVFSCSFDVFKGECELRVFLVYHLDSASSQKNHIFKLIIFSALLHVLEKAIRQRRKQAKPLPYLSMEEKKRKRERWREIDGDKEK